MRRAALVTLGLALGLPLYLAAQAPGSLSPGKRIRVQTESSSSWVILVRSSRWMSTPCAWHGPFLHSGGT